MTYTDRCCTFSWCIDWGWSLETFEPSCGRFQALAWQLCIDLAGGPLEVGEETNEGHLWQSWLATQRQLNVPPPHCGTWTLKRLQRNSWHFPPMHGRPSWAETNLMKHQPSESSNTICFGSTPLCEENKRPLQDSDSPPAGHLDVPSRRNPSRSRKFWASPWPQMIGTWIKHLIQNDSNRFG